MGLRQLQAIVFSVLVLCWGCGANDEGGSRPADVSDTALEVIVLHDLEEGGSTPTDLSEVAEDISIDVEEEEIADDPATDADEEEGGIDISVDSSDDDAPDEVVPDVSDLDVQQDTTDLEDVEEEEPPTCQDQDGDGRGEYCDLGPDCDESSAAHWADCGSCFDQDGDDRGINCDLGSDCTEYSPRHWADCMVCVDIDGDGRGPQCDLGADCAIEDGRHWADCGVCNDDDGDGYGADCDLGEDCDEDDPFIHPRALDLPWDGVDDDCSGADLIPADALGVFVSTATGTSDGAGSRTDPLDSIQAGIDLAKSSDLPYVFVEQGDYSEWLAVWPGIQIIGGFSNGFDTWDPSLYISRVLPGSPTGGNAVEIHSFPAPVISTSTALSGLTIKLANTRSYCSGISTSTVATSPSHALTLSHIEIYGDEAGCYTSFGIGMVDAGFDSLLRDVKVGNLAAITLSTAVYVGGGRLLVIDSQLTGGPSDNTYTLSAAGSTHPIQLSVINTVLTTSGVPGGYAVRLNGEGGLLDAYFAHDVIGASQAGPIYTTYPVAIECLNSVLKGTAIAVNTFAASPSIVLLNNALDLSSLVWSDVNVLDLETLHDCAWAGCAEASGNIIVRPVEFIDDPPFHLGSDSPLVDSGLDIEVRGDLELPLVLEDIDGEFRPQGTGWDIGIDEVTE